ncbi:lysylphosphatidylglycerol synthase domain-containing protein [Gemmatimonas sp.]
MRLSATLRRPAVRTALLLLTFSFIGWALHQQWAAVRVAARNLDLHWPWIVAASAMVLVTYAVLVQSWRMLLAGWGGHLPYLKAVQIWTVANLGRYLPGKVWSIGALGVLAAREGVSGVAAAGAAVLGTLLNIGAGFAVSVIFGADLLDAVAPGLRSVSVGAAIVFIVGVAMLPFVLPALLDKFSRWRGLPLAKQQLKSHEVWTAAFINTMAWVGYGVAFAWFARGVSSGVAADPILFTAVYAASYLVGYLVLFAPGGVGFREVALTTLLITAGVAGQGDAAVLAATSRVWLTVLEVVPGLIGLALMSPTERRGLNAVESGGAGAH